MTETTPTGDSRQLLQQFISAWKQGPAPDLAPYLDAARRLGDEKLVEQLSTIDSQNRQGNENGGARRNAQPTLLGNDVFSALSTVDGDSDEPTDRGTQTPTSAESFVSGHFQLIRKHAAGGLGEVWLARDTSLNREVAIKRVRPEIRNRSHAIARFDREAQITGQLDHPGIVPVHEANRGSDGEPFYVMRFLNGRTLHEAIADYHATSDETASRPIRFRELLDALVDVCNAVDFAHARGVVHRDLKPDNIILGEFGEVVVLDWGLAKFTDPAQSGHEPYDTEAASGDDTQAGAVMGTVPFMAPEQAAGEIDRIDARTDVYGLGAILYVILTGQAPHRGTTDKMLSRISQGPPPEPRDFHRGIETPLNAICARAMAHEPDQRYGNARELADDIRRWLADEPVSVHLQTWVERASRWSRRHRTAVASAGILLLVSLLAMAALAVVLENSRRTLDTELGRTAEERNRADANLTMADNVLRQTLLRLGDKSMAHIPGFNEPRREILLDALKFYQALQQANRESSRADVATAQTQLRIAEICELLGKTAESAVALKDAHSTLDTVLQTRPRNPLARHLKAEVLRLNGMALDFQDNELDNMQTMFGQAEALWNDLLTEDPGNVNYVGKLGEVKYTLATVLRAKEEFDDSRKKFAEAIALQQQLLDKDPADPNRRHKFGRIQNSVGAFYADTGEKERAIEALGTAESIFEALIKDRGFLEDSVELGHVHNTRGVIFSQIDKLEDAAAAFEKALVVRQRLAEQHPTLLYLRTDVAGTRSNMAMIYARQGKLDQALQASLESEQQLQSVVDEDPNDPTAGRYLEYTRQQIAQLRRHIAEQNKNAQNDNE